MFENITVSSLYKKIETFEALTEKHTNITMFFYCLGFMFIIFSIITGVFLYEIQSAYTAFIIIPILIGVFTLFIPRLFANFSKLSELLSLYEDLVSDLSKSKTQLELINFFDSINIDNRFLQVQFANQDYEVCIRELSTLLSNKKQAIQQNELINNYQKKLKEKETPKLKLVS